MAARLIVMLIVVVGWLAVPPLAHAQLQITVTDGNTDPMPIAVPNFQAMSPEVEEAAAKIAEVVRTDLESSGLFRALDPESFIQRDLNLDYKPTFMDWRVIKADALVTGRIGGEDDGKLLVEFRLWDVFKEEQLSGLRFTTPETNWRRIAHKVADAVYEQLTGDKGYFDSRIVFVEESGPKTDRRKRLAVMDQDGANKQFLLAGDARVLTPRFDPSSQTIAYLSYEDGVPRVYLYELLSGRRELLGDFPNMTYAPRFAPDGQSLLLTLNKDGNSDIYRVGLASRSTTRLTSDPADDLSGSYAPDGEAIVFNSNRGGSAQIYRMNPDGSGVKRLSFGEGRFFAPVWSPRGDLIAFVRALDGKFGIGVMAPDGSNMRMLAESYMDEGPSWAPNGRTVMFFRTERGSGNNQLYAVDITGRNLRRVDTGGQASDPAWSPLLLD